MALPFHGLVHNWYAQLNAAIDADDTTLVLKDSGATGAPAVPFFFEIDNESLRCTAISVDTPSAGLDTLTVSRGEQGTSGASYAADTWAQHLITTSFALELQRRLAVVERLLVDSYGGADGVMATSADRTQLKVVALSSPNMTVRVNAGACIAGGMPASLAAYYDTAAIVAPTANPRIDVVEIGVNPKTGATEVLVVTGTEAGSPSAPSVTSGYYKLGEIYCRVGMTSVKNTDDSTNGYITDARRFL